MWKPPAGDGIKSTKVCTIQGFKRRFWQQSLDHRGTPEKPGLVATLVPQSHPDVEAEPGEATLGVAYEVDLTSEFLKDLDFRERNGYTRTLVNCEALGGGSDPFSAIVYYAQPGHDAAYVGPKTPEETAATIKTSAGPSGTNLEYFKNLLDFLRSQKQRDPYLELVAAHIPL